MKTYKVANVIVNLPTGVELAYGGAFINSSVVTARIRAMRDNPTWTSIVIVLMPPYGNEYEVLNHD